MKFYDMKQVSNMLHMNEADIKAQIRLNQFPQPIQIKCRVWSEKDILRWLEKRKPKQGEPNGTAARGNI